MVLDRFMYPRPNECLGDTRDPWDPYCHRESDDPWGRTPYLLSGRIQSHETTPCETTKGTITEPSISLIWSVTLARRQGVAEIQASVIVPIDRVVARSEADPQPSNPIATACQRFQRPMTKEDVRP